MPAPRDIPQKIPAPRAKIRMQKPQSGGEFSVQIPGGARGGGWSWQKLITALMLCNLTAPLPLHHDHHCTAIKVGHFDHGVLSVYFVFIGNHPYQLQANILALFCSNQ